MPYRWEKECHRLFFVMRGGDVRSDMPRLSLGVSCNDWLRRWCCCSVGIVIGDRRIIVIYVVQRRGVMVVAGRPLEQQWCGVGRHMEWCSHRQVGQTSL